MRAISSFPSTQKYTFPHIPNTTPTHILTPTLSHIKHTQAYGNKLTHYVPDNENCAACKFIRECEKKQEYVYKHGKGIFRFNPGKQKKAVPDYNPYTISRCNDCDIPKKGLKLAKYIPDSELCSTCILLRQCKEQVKTNAFSQYIKEYKNNAKQIGLEEQTSLQTKKYYQTKKSFKRAIGHAFTIEEADTYSIIHNYINDFNYEALSPLGEGKDLSNPKDRENVKKKRERGVTGYNIYTVKIGQTEWIVKTEICNNKKETVYHIMKKR